MVITTPDLSEMMGEESTEDIEKFQKAYEKQRQEKEFIRNKFIADYWTSAFFWQHKDKNEEYPKPEVLDSLLKDKHMDLSGKIRHIATSGF